MPMADLLVAVGEVLRPYGLDGELRVRPLTDRPLERFRRRAECVLWEPGTDQRRPCRIEAARVEGDTVLLKLDGIDSPEAAGALRGRLLAVDREDVLPAPAGTFYPWQMQGARVETGDGRVVGVFARVQEGAAQDLWVVQDGDRELLIPAVAEIVVDVNVAERRIVIDPPDGLLEL